MTCQAMRDLLAEYVADGEPLTARYASLRMHLQQCEACRQDLTYLRDVEQALRAWPLEKVSVPLRERLLATLDMRNDPALRYPQLWSIWLPIVTILTAIALALALAPAPLPLTLAVPQGGKEWAPMVIALDQETLQAILVGIGVALAGIGVTVALAQGELPGHEDLDAFRGRASHAVESIWRPVSHSH